MLELKQTHADEMLANLLQEYRGQANLEFFIHDVLGPQVQDLENAFIQILADTNIDQSFGAQLDGWGRLVDLARNGMDDPTYTLYLKAKILVNRSTGTLQEIIAVLDILLGAPTLVILEPPDTDAATIEISITSALGASIIGDVVGSILMKAKDAGVRLLVTYFHSPAFEFDTVAHGFDTAGIQWGGTFGG
jgi:hypothetical protein